VGFKRHLVSEPRVDLTPMIDVVFLLLIFFMISTTFVEHPGFKIDLPDSSVQQITHEGGEVQVYLNEEGKIYFQQQEISLDELAGKLHDYGTVVTNMTFLLMADQEVRHGRVIRLMDVAKSAGFEKLAIATDQEVTSTELPRERKK
jgi:biopolymer transport protein ExbD/biopolymer transport protein TolR